VFPSREEKGKGRKGWRSATEPHYELPLGRLPENASEKESTNMANTRECPN